MWPFEKKKKPLSFEEFQAQGSAPVTEQQPPAEGRPLSFEQFQQQSQAPEIPHDVRDYAASRDTIGTAPQSVADFGKPKEPPVAKPVDQVEWEKKTFSEKVGLTLNEIPNTLGEHFKKTGEALGQDLGTFTPTKPWEEMSINEKAKAGFEEAKGVAIQEPVRQILGSYSKGASAITGVGGFFGVPGSEKAASTIQKYRQDYEKGLKPTTYQEGDNIFQNPALLANPEYISRNIMDQIPNFAAMSVTGGLGEGILELGGAYNERMLRNKESRQEAPAVDRLYAGTVGIVNGFLGKIGFDAIMQKNPVVKSFVQESVNKTIGKAISAVASTGIEMTTEYIQEILPQIATKVIYDEGGNWQKVLQDANKQGLSAASSAGVISAPISTLNVINGDSQPVEPGMSPAVREEDPLEKIPQQPIENAGQAGIVPQPIDNAGQATPVKKPSENAIELLYAIRNDDEETFQSLINTVSKEELEASLAILDQAQGQLSPEDQTATQDDRAVIETLIQERDDQIQESVGQDVVEGTNQIDSLNDGDRKAAMDTLKQVADSQSELSDKAKEIVAQVENTNKVVEATTAEIKETKKELLAQKKQAATEEEKKRVQSEINALDESKHIFEGVKNTRKYVEPVKSAKPKQPGKFFDNGQAVVFDGKSATVTAVLKQKGDTKYQMTFDDGRELWTNHAGLEKENTIGLTIKKPSVSPKKSDVKATVPSAIAEHIKNTTGKGFEKASSKEIQAALDKTKGNIPDRGGSLVQKVGSAALGVEDIFSSSSMIKPQIVGTIGNGVFTDSFILINDKAKTKELTEKLIDKNAKKEGKKMSKSGKISYDKAYQAAVDRMRASIEEYKNDAPKLKGILLDSPSDLEVSIVGHVGVHGTVVSVGDETELLDTHKLAFMLDMFPGAKMYTPELNKPVEFVKNGKIVGLIMPMRREGFESPFKDESQQLTEKPKDDTIKPINESYENNRPEEVPDTSNVQPESNLGSGGETSGEISGYERATVLAESGNGLSSNGSDVSKLKKSERQLINEEVEALLESKDYSSNPDDYTLDEKTLLSAYSGAGGKESVGGSGAGLLNEYYTPQTVIDKLWEISMGLNPNIQTAFEPSAGTGRIITSAPAGVKMGGVEISKVSGTIAQVLNPNSEITIGDFQELFFDRKTNKQIRPSSYDLIIGNPPFGDRAGFLKGKGEESRIGRDEEYFIKRGLDMTNEGGYLVYVVNSSFLKSGKSYGKEQIAKIGTLVSAYRLPENVFEDTSIGTDIVVFQKNKAADDLAIMSRKRTLTEDTYFRGSIGGANVLGETKTRKNRFGKEETYVEGTLENVSKVVVPKATKGAVLTKEALQKKPAAKREKVVKPNKPAAPRKPSSSVVLPKPNYSKLVSPVKNISNVRKVNPVQVEMLKKVDRNLAIEEPTDEEKAVLNYQIVNGEGMYFPDPIFFSGNINEKVESLKKNKAKIVAEIGESRYDLQLAGLEKVRPEVLDIRDIVFDPIDRHINKMMIKNDRGSEMSLQWHFIRYLFNNDITFSPRVRASHIERYVLGRQAEKETKPIMGLIKADAKRFFNKFIQDFVDVEVQKEIVEKYNKEKNSYVRPDFSKLPIEVKEMADQFRGTDFMMSQTQKEGVAFLVNKGTGLIAYGVGVGKTHTLAIATKVNMDKGWTKKPLFIVPKSTIEATWINTLHEMFPSLVINNLEGLQAPIIRRMEKERGLDRKEWIREGELTVISHEGILRLGFNDEEMQELTGDLEDALSQEDMKMPKTERQREKEKQKIEEITGKAQKFVTNTMFSDLGFDHISVDEVHNFRKIFQGAKPEKKEENQGGGFGKRFSNIVGGTPSKRAQQLFLIAQHVQKKNNNRNVFLASATPFENHATESYNILSLIARDRMKEMGIFNINDYFSTFADFVVEIDRRLDGEYINREKMNSYSNVQVLQGLVKEFIDRQEDETLVRPERRVITPQLQMSQMQEDNLQNIQDLLNGVSRSTDDPSLVSMDESGKPEDGAFLKASTYSIANSISPYFIKEYVTTPPTAKQLVDASPKIKYALEAVRLFKKDKRTREFGTFIFFGKMGVEYHPMIAEYFAKELGYKENEVAYLSGNVTDDQKEAIKNRFNSGEIKVLLGGDQTKEGIDLQNNGFATINLALGWNPTQIQQVEGRVWRQGNRRSIAPLIYPLVENSGDAMIYSKFQEKGGRINDLFSYSGKVFDVSEVDPGEKKLALITDPKDKANLQVQLDKAALENELSILETEKKDYIRMSTDNEQFARNIVDYTERLKSAKASLAERPDSTYYIEQIEYLKKELKKSTEKRARIQARLAEKKITDLSESINQIREKVELTEKKIEEVKETYPVLLARFTEEYNEQIKNRKTMEQHMEEVSMLIDEVSERTPEEIAEIRKGKIEELEAKRALEDEGSIKARTATRDENGRFTGSVSEKISNQEIRAGLSDKEAREIIKKVEAELNPSIKAAYFLELTNRILIKGQDPSFQTEGYFSPSRSLLKLALETTPEKFESVLRHELRHVAFMMLPESEQQKIKEWYLNLPELQKHNLFKEEGYSKDINGSGGFYEYLKDSKEAKDWDGSPLDSDLFMADEAFNRYMETIPPTAPKTAIEKTLDSIITSLQKLIARIIKAVFNINVRERGKKVESIFENVFNPSRPGYFIAPEGYLETMTHRYNKRNSGTQLAYRSKPVADTEYVKNGKVKVLAVYQRVYQDIYGVKAPPLNSIQNENLIRGVGKRSFTAGKWQGVKVTRQNYKEINRQIRDYIIQHIPMKDRGRLLRAVIAAKSEGDVKNVVAKVDEMTSERLAIEAAKAFIVEQIERKELRKTENLRKAMKLPPIQKMTLEQLEEFGNALSTTMPKDEFLTQRMLETVRLTELKGVRTVKEVRKVLEAKLGAKFDENGISVSSMNRFKWDTSLAESDPFMRMLVEEKDMAFLKADAATLVAEEEIDKLAKASRKSIPRTIADVLIPEDPQVFEYLESENKKELARDMTPEQLKLAIWLKGEFEKMRDYLVQNQQLKGVRENYITHIRKDFLETWKNAGILKAVQGVFEQQRLDEAVFEILSEDTGEIIAFEKWFQFAMRRSDVIDPSKNVMGAYLAYKRSFERKVALDSVIPKIMVYTYALTPSNTTERGLTMDQSLKKFIVTWLNSKKGRHVDFNGFAKQGAVVDTLLRLLKIAVSIKYLAFSIAVGVASNVGEQGATFVSMGGKMHAKGIKRAHTQQGKAIIKKYENFVGQSIWKVLSLGSRHIGNKVLSASFGLFHDAQVRANKYFLLGSLTDEEFENGEVSIERLASMKVELGRWRVVEGSNSVFGATSPGKIATQFKSWAIVSLRSTIDNIQKIKESKDIRSKEAQETLRQIYLVSSVTLLTLMIFGDDDEEDKSFFANLRRKLIREGFSMAQALQPSFFFTLPVGIDLVFDFVAALEQIVALSDYKGEKVLGERYKTSKKGEYKAGDNKGINAMERVITPNIWKQFIDE